MRISTTLNEIEKSVTQLCKPFLETPSKKQLHNVDRICTDTWNEFRIFWLISKSMISQLGWWAKTGKGRLQRPRQLRTRRLTLWIGSTTRPTFYMILRCDDELLIIKLTLQWTSHRYNLLKTKKVLGTFTVLDHIRKRCNCVCVFAEDLDKWYHINTGK